MGLGEVLAAEGGQHEHVEGVSVNVVERLKELVLDEDINYGDSFVYEYHAGYETLTHRGAGRGGLHYSGTHHPKDGFCETDDGSGGPGICRWCGSTLW